jgi:hypothetical protein
MVRYIPGPILFFTCISYVFPVLFAKAASSRANLPTIKLRLGVASSTISLLPGNTITTLPFEDLFPNHHYELRVNWPATSPGKFTIWVDHNKNAILPPSFNNAQHQPLKLGRRHLLNAHKEIFQFQMEEKGRLTYGHIRVEKEGISWNPLIEKRPVVFNVILEETFLGVLPKRTLPLVFCLLFFILVGIVFVVPKIEFYINQHHNRNKKEFKERR